MKTNSNIEIYSNKLTLSFLFLFVFILSCSDQNTTNFEVDSAVSIASYTATDVRYGPDSNQIFDIYLPENRTPNTKIVVLIHGGGWVSGDKRDMNAIKDYIQDTHPNLGLINMNYTLAEVGNPPIPLQTDDITKVVTYIKDNQSSLIVGDDVGFIGFSAGAHLSLLWSYAYDINHQVRMTCSIAGPTNFTDPSYYYSINPVFQSMYYLFGNPSIEFLESVSPYHRTTTQSPPTLLLYGGLDPLVPTSQGFQMRDQLDDFGIPHEFIFYEQEGHGWSGANWVDSLNRISNFLDTYLLD